MRPVFMTDEKRYLRELRKKLLSEHNAYMNTADLVHKNTQFVEVAQALTAAGLAIDGAVHAIENALNMNATGEVLVINPRKETTP